MAAPAAIAAVPAPAAENKNSEFLDFLKQFHVTDIMVKNQQVITVSTEQTPMEAFKVILDHDILSAPVYEPKHQQYIGFLDVRDLVSFLVFEAEEHKKEVELKNHSLNTLFDSATKMYQKPLEGITVSYMSKRNKFIPVTPDEPLLKVFEILSSPHVHRVPVVSKDTEQVIGIISQQNVLNFIYNHRESFANEFAKTIEQTHLGSRPVIPVSYRATALDTLKLMSKYNKSGIAVVDAQGKFMGNTSGTDLKIIVKHPQNFMKALSLSIMDFLAMVRQHDLSLIEKSPTIGVTEHDTIGKVIGKLFATKVHRVFCVDADHKPVAVISITDVLQYIMKSGGVEPKA